MKWKTVFDCYPDAQQIFVVDDMPFLDAGQAETHAKRTNSQVETVGRDAIAPEAPTLLVDPEAPADPALPFDPEAPADPAPPVDPEAPAAPAPAAPKKRSGNKKVK